MEFLKVKLLTRTHPHHVRLELPAPLTTDLVQYYALDTKKAEKLTAAEVVRWKANLPAADELDEMVEALTDHKFYREARRQVP